MYGFGASWSMPPLAPGAPRQATLFTALYGKTMHSAQLLLHDKPCMAPSIRVLVSCAFALLKCAGLHQITSFGGFLTAQTAPLIALIEQFSALFERGCFGFVASFAAPASAALLLLRWWGRS